MDEVCRYYNGSEDHSRCEAGIAYGRVTPRIEKFGSVYRQPCFKVTSQHGLMVLLEHGPQGRCPFYSPGPAVASLGNTGAK